ncbi:hypothetical protein HK097_007128 [Rhizophlyctis rosea]|uniref:Uncharacterized protein n=1 Tax=Rhizophlyctis rosea TaxID=64517 RepID=A0AAD5X4N2_9FUNG|nr:hypothetical protein HK097_007128 [Rhizophlyctis rosea]
MLREFTDFVDNTPRPLRQRKATLHHAPFSSPQPRFLEPANDLPQNSATSLSNLQSRSPANPYAAYDDHFSSEEDTNLLQQLPDEDFERLLHQLDDDDQNDNLGSGRVPSRHSEHEAPKSIALDEDLLDESHQEMDKVRILEDELDQLDQGDLGLSQRGEDSRYTALSRLEGLSELELTEYGDGPELYINNFDGMGDEEHSEEQLSFIGGMIGVDEALETDESEMASLPPARKHRQHSANLSESSFKNNPLEFSRSEETYQKPQLPEVGMEDPRISGSQRNIASSETHPYPRYEVPSGLDSTIDRFGTSEVGHDRDASLSDTRLGLNAGATALQDMLLKAREECQSLQSMNERLIKTNQELQAHLDALQWSQQKKLSDLEQEHEMTVSKLQREAAQRLGAHQTETRHLKDELLKAKVEQTHIGSIRDSLQREKELDLMNIKKDLLGQKERQLEEIRRELEREKEAAARKLEEANRQMQHSFNDEMNTLRRELQEKSERIADLEIVLANASGRPAAEDFSQQHDALWEVHQQLEVDCNRQRAVLQYVTEQLGQAIPEGIMSEPNESDIRGLAVKCRRHIAHCEQTVGDLRAELQLRKEMRSKESCLVAVNRDLENRLAQVEEDHMQILASMNAAHEVEIVTLRTAHDARLTSLNGLLEQRKRTSSAGSDVASSPDALPNPVTLKNILAKYPSQMRQYRTSIDAEHVEQRLAAEAEHAGEMALRTQRFNAMTLQMQSGVEAERNAGEQRRKEEIAKVSKRLKEQCSQAYDSAVQKLRREYAELEKSLREKLAQEKAAYQRDRSTSGGSGTSGGGNLWENDLSSERERMQKEIASLRKEIDHLTLQRDEATTEAERRATEALHENLNKMKLKYLTTLRAMRDDLAKSKERGMERLEAEWKRRKERLDAEWQHSARKTGWGTRHYCVCIRLVTTKNNYFGSIGTSLIDRLSQWDSAKHSFQQSGSMETSGSFPNQY